jgi:hypothetical protein
VTVPVLLPPTLEIFESMSVLTSVSEQPPKRHHASLLSTPLNVIANPNPNPNNTFLFILILLFIFMG